MLRFNAWLVISCDNLAIVTSAVEPSYEISTSRNVEYASK